MASSATCQVKKGYYNSNLVNTVKFVFDYIFRLQLSLEEWYRCPCFLVTGTRIIGHSDLRVSQTIKWFFFSASNNHIFCFQQLHFLVPKTTFSCSNDLKLVCMCVCIIDYSINKYFIFKNIIHNKIFIIFLKIIFIENCIWNEDQGCKVFQKSCTN